MSIAVEFKEFVLRGNVVDLAVGVVIGGAFGTIVKSFVGDIITPPVGLPGKHDLSGLKYTVHGQVFQVGDFLNSIVSFLIIAAVVFFLVVKPLNHLQSLRKVNAEPDTPPSLTREEVLLTEIRDALQTRAERV